MSPMLGLPSLLSYPFTLLILLFILTNYFRLKRILLFFKFKNHNCIFMVHSVTLWCMSITWMVKTNYLIYIYDLTYFLWWDIWSLPVWDIFFSCSPHAVQLFTRNHSSHLTKNVSVKHHLPFPSSCSFAVLNDRHCSLYPVSLTFLDHTCMWDTQFYLSVPALFT
jgi:hypothetical protein